MKRYLFVALLLFSFGCRRSGELPPMSLDTLKPAGDTSFRPKDPPQTKADTTHSNLPPMAKAIDPNRLANFLPRMPGWTSDDELQKEIQIRENFNRSRAAQSYIMGPKKLK